jgi:hypothetical protein
MNCRSSTTDARTPGPARAGRSFRPAPALRFIIQEDLLHCSHRNPNPG